MKKENAIFGLRYDANEKLIPSQEDLRAFLKSAHFRQGGALDAFRERVAEIHAFELSESEAATPPAIRDKMYYGVLGLSSFFSHALLSAIEEYHYHLRALQALDFKKPASFIHSAEAEMGKLNPKKKEDAAKVSKLKGMIEERKRILEKLKKEKTTLTSELIHIAGYIRDNLHKIGSVCEASIVVLVDFQLQKREEGRLIEEIKTQFRENLKEAAHNGVVTRAQMESVKNDVELLSQEISTLVREDVYAITGMYEAIYEQVKSKAAEINALLGRTIEKAGNGPDPESELFSQLGQVLISLISTYRFDLHMNPVRTKTGHHAVFLEKRNEMLTDLYALLETERRSSNDRRSARNRRTVADPGYPGPDRRKIQERRSGKNRRKAI